ncbi:hypothetical protein DJ013_12940 [Arcticibacterium luteifluviistationis]|uniref:Galactose oxidase n=2 Tax=Arcticibacterium luteifluviistationis TaxID=1784714 RepID=A0A2Z4GCY9_9BACT|nr:hypothetical protein DJ013_12940 [Arcticibacterium luteifluviistationis]
MTFLKKTKPRLSSIWAYAILPLLALCYTTSFAQQHGLGFHGNERISDQRTSLILDDISIDKTYEISFKVKMNLTESNFYGYVFRLIDKNDNNIDLIFRSKTFQLILGQQNFDLSGKSVNEIDTEKWNNIKFIVNAAASKIAFYINDELLVESKITNNLSKAFTIYFGQSHHPGFSYKDVTAMTLKDVKITSEGKLKHYWPLDEISGTIAKDLEGELNGEVINPKWVRRKNYDWEVLLDTDFEGLITTSYNSSKNQLHLYSGTNHFFYNFQDNNSNTETYNSYKPKIAFGDAGISFKENNGILRINENRLFIFDPIQKNFTSQINEPDSLTEYWHHNTYVFPEDSALATIGGYGMFAFKNNFQKYSLQKDAWENLEMKGDIPAPRYLAGLGNEKKSTTSYYIGGYGSDSGDQLITPKNYYDFFKIDWRNNQITKVYTLPNPEESFVFGNNLIIQEDKDQYFGIVFNQLKHNSELQLVQGSLEKPDLKRIAKKIPFQFNDVRTTVHLYHNDIDQKLFLAVSYHDIDLNKTNLKLYEISIPEANPAISTATSDFRLWILTGILGIVALLLIRAYYQRKGKAKTASPIKTLGEETVSPQESKIIPETIKSSVILFGEFQITNQNGKDLTRSFSPLLKEIFVYLLMHTLRWNKGLSSSKLDEMFWYDKSKASARNNRAVNIRKLKSILEDIDGVSLIKKTGNLEVEFDENLAFIDYAKFLKIALFEPQNSKEQIDQLSNIVQRGTLLPNQDLEWLDSFKSETSNKIIDKYLLYSESLTLTKDNAEEHIEIANNIFLFDSLDEVAMSMKCRAQHILGKHTLAKETYEKFITNYQSLFNEKFIKSYQEILEVQPPTTE